ncbi:APC family permease [Thalassotalea euphylliae]|uniref:APC family permease n=1 Tax=Thalassotalea euphylliae TaxID=1655234 RepID=UPI00363B3518
MSENNLSRAIGKLGIAALAINGLIGAGIFALPASAAALSGSWSPWAFIVCALLMSLVILSFAQLSRGFDETGGPVAYTQKAFGNHVAFQTTWLLYVGRLTALAANTNALLLYISFFLPEIKEGLWHAISSLFVLTLLLLINLRNVGQAMSVIQGITILKLLPLIAFILVGMSFWDNDIVFAFNSEDLGQFDVSLLLIVYAFIGFEGALVPAGESENPKKNIGYALITTLVVTAVMYFLIQSISLSVLPDLSDSTTPLADAATVMVGSVGAVIITIAAIVSIWGNLTTVVFTAPRMTYALAKEQNLPKWFGELSETHHVPQNAISFLVIVAAVLAVTGSFVWLAIISSLARLIGYFISIAALIKLRPEYVQQNVWFLPFGILVPCSALAVCLWLAFQASASVWMFTLLFAGVGSAMFIVTKRKLD